MLKSAIPPPEESIPPLDSDAKLVAVSKHKKSDGIKADCTDNHRTFKGRNYSSLSPGSSVAAF